MEKTILAESKIRGGSIRLVKNEESNVIGKGGYTVSWVVPGETGVLNSGSLKISRERYMEHLGRLMRGEKITN